MRLLLDTHVWLWFLEGDQRLSESLKSAIQLADNEVYVSVVSLFEAAIKINIGKLETSNSLQELEAATLALGFKILAMNSTEVFAYQHIPLIENHKDPFDRMLLAISKANSFTLATHDEKMKLYSDLVEVLS